MIQACADMYDVTNQGVGFSPIDRGLVNAEIQRMTRKGLRVLAIAVKRL